MRERDMYAEANARDAGKQAEKVHQKSSNKFIKFVCKCFLNDINGKVPKDKSLLENYEESFRHFLSKETSLRKMRQLLEKKNYSYSVTHKSLLLPLLVELLMHVEEFLLLPKESLCQNNQLGKKIG